MKYFEEIRYYSNILYVSSPEQLVSQIFIEIMQRSFRQDVGGTAVCRHPRLCGAFQTPGTFSQTNSQVGTSTFRRVEKLLKIMLRKRVLI